MIEDPEPSNETGTWLGEEERRELFRAGFTPGQAGMREPPSARLARYADGAARLLTAPLRALPDFLVVGGQRCGTTSLYMAIHDHPQFLPPVRKEVHHFDWRYRRGLLWYRAAFPLRSAMRRRAREIGRTVVTGEATPGYVFSPGAPERIRRALPEVRLVAVLRDPVDRAWSHYWLNRRRGFEPLSFEAALAAEEERIRTPDPDAPDAAGPSDRSRYSYRARGVYVDQLRRFEAWMPDRMLVLGFDELFGGRADGWRALGDFLGIDPADFPPPPSLLSSSSSAPEMEPGTRARLEAFYRPHDRRLADFLGRELAFTEE